MYFNNLVLLFTIFGIVNILFHKNGLQNSLFFIIIAFVLGYRTFELYPGVNIHPIELFILFSLIRISFMKIDRCNKIPTSIMITGYFFLAVFIIDYLTRYHSSVLMEFKNAYYLILIFYIIQYIKLDKRNFQLLLKYYIYITTAISLIGITEYINPSLITMLFGTIYNEQTISSHQLFFKRLGFFWWGSHLAANLIPPAFPILLYLISIRDRMTQNKIIVLIIVSLNLGAVYLSGNRISWLILTCFFFYTLFIYKNSIVPYIKTSSILVVVTFVIVVYSQPFEGRYISTFKALSGNIDKRYDSSGNIRLQHIDRAIKSIIERPNGKGWASIGWIHSDVLQLSASIGIIPSFLFFAWIIILFIRLQLVYFSIEKKEKTVFFILSLFIIHIIISFLLNGNILLVQTGMPLYLLLAITYYYYAYSVRLENYIEA